jgi:hypothetical protein
MTFSTLYWNRHKNQKNKYFFLDFTFSKFSDT